MKKNNSFLKVLIALFLILAVYKFFTGNYLGSDVGIVDGGTGGGGTTQNSNTNNNNYSSNNQPVLITEFYAYINGERGEKLVVNIEASPMENLVAEYMITLDLTAGYKLDFGSSTEAKNVWFENSETNTFTVSISGSYTFYLKSWQDGGLSCWGSLNETPVEEVVPYYVYTYNGNKFTFEENDEATLGDNQVAEYIVSYINNYGHELNIYKNTDEEVIDVYFENTSSTDFTCDEYARYTVYLKEYADGTYSAWINVDVNIHTLSLLGLTEENSELTETTKTHLKVGIAPISESPSPYYISSSSTNIYKYSGLGTSSIENPVEENISKVYIWGYGYSLDGETILECGSTWDTATELILTADTTIYLVTGLVGESTTE